MTIGRRRRFLAGGCAGLAAIALAVAAAPASAYWAHVEIGTQAPGFAGRTATSDCTQSFNEPFPPPDAADYVIASATGWSDTSDAWVQSAFPAADLKSVTATITPPNGAQAAVGYNCVRDVWGLHRVAHSRVIGSLTRAPFSTSVTCPGQERVFGLGAKLTGGPAYIGLNEFRPTPDLRTVEVGAIDPGIGGLLGSLLAGPWTLTAYAVCGTPSPGQSLTLMSEHASTSAGDHRLQINLPARSCPASNAFLPPTEPVAVGAAITALLPVAGNPPPDVGIEGLWHNFAEARQSGATPQSPPWGLTAYRICLTAAPVS
jgi:hypothetical protein